jgi:hypothetical protein
MVLGVDDEPPPWRRALRDHDVRLHCGDQGRAELVEPVQDLRDDVVVCEVMPQEVADESLEEVVERDLVPLERGEGHVPFLLGRHRQPVHEPADRQGQSVEPVGFERQRSCLSGGGAVTRVS